MDAPSTTALSAVDVAMNTASSAVDAPSATASSTMDVTMTTDSSGVNEIMTKDWPAMQAQGRPTRRGNLHPPNRSILSNSAKYHQIRTASNNISFHLSSTAPTAETAH